MNRSPLRVGVPDQFPGRARWRLAEDRPPRLADHRRCVGLHEPQHRPGCTMSRRKPAGGSRPGRPDPVHHHGPASRTVAVTPAVDDIAV